MKKQTWMVLSVLVVSAVGSMQAYAGRDPDLSVPRKIRDAEKSEHRAEHATPSPWISPIPTPSMTPPRSFEEGRSDGYKDGGDYVYGTMCDDRLKINWAEVRVKYISTLVLRNLDVQYTKGYVEGYGAGYEASAFYARKDSAPCKN